MLGWGPWQEVQVRDETPAVVLSPWQDAQATFAVRCGADGSYARCEPREKSAATADAASAESMVPAAA